MRRKHLEQYVIFIQQRWKYLRYKKAIRTIRTCIIRKRYIELKKNISIIKRRYLEYTYKPGNTGYRRILERWRENVKDVNR
jgi:hypothetical protein